MAEKPTFIDANVFLRHITQDSPDQSRRAQALLKRIDGGELIVTTSEAVILELVFVLSSRRLYNLSREDIRSRLHILLALKGLRLPLKAVYHRALDLYAANPGIDFADCVNVAHMEHAGISEIWSFDKDYARMKGHNGVIAREP